MFCNTSRAFFLAIVAVTAGTASHALMDGPWLNLPTFSGDLTRELYTNTNDCTSVWGLSMMFDLLGPGTDNENTLSQFCVVIGLCYDGDKQLLWNDTVAQLETVYDGKCDYTNEQDCEAEQSGYRPLLRIANSIWIDNAAELQPVYQDTVGELVHQIEFNDPLAGGSVNDWVNQSTLGLIDSILDDGRIDGNLVAVNTIYLKADWSVSFDQAFTSTDTFYVDQSTTIESHFMHQSLEGSGLYSHTALNGYQMLKLGFGQSSGLLSMIFVLPLQDSAGSAENLEQDMQKLRNLTPDKVIVASRNLDEPHSVAVALPKFKFESEYKDTLKAALLSLGLTDPFDFNNPVFCGMIEGLEEDCLTINLIIQKTSIDVNEKGVIAAAATGAQLTTTSAGPIPTPVLFLANRPFKFFIYDGIREIVVFEGMVGAPEIPDGSTAPHDGSHNDVWNDFSSIRTPVQPTSGSGCAFWNVFCLLSSLLSSILSFLLSLFGF